MTNIASCGHKIAFRKIFDNAVYVKARSITNKPAISYLVLCPKCLKQAQRDGIILETEAQQKTWLAGNGKGKVW